MALVFVRKSPSRTALGAVPAYDPCGSIPATPSDVQVSDGQGARHLKSGGGKFRRLGGEAGRYQAIDASDGFYRSPVDPAVRSHTNVVWRLPTEELEATFVAEAKRAGLVGLKGHRSVGGIRASIYAATEMPAVEALVAFMEEFAADNRP